MKVIWNLGIEFLLIILKILNQHQIDYHQIENHILRQEHHQIGIKYLHVVKHLIQLEKLIQYKQNIIFFIYFNVKQF